MPPAARHRGQGQWALGYHEPLNKNEENKKNDDGLNEDERASERRRRMRRANAA